MTIGETPSPQTNLVSGCNLGPLLPGVKIKLLRNIWLYALSLRPHQSESGMARKTDIWQISGGQQASSANMYFLPPDATLSPINEPFSRLSPVSIELSDQSVTTPLVGMLIYHRLTIPYHPPPVGK